MLLPIRSVDGKVRRHLVLSILTLSMLSILCPPSRTAQSLDKNNPTPLRTREINGRASYPVPRTGWARTFYYVFTAKAGRWSAKVTTHAGNDSKTGVRYKVSFDQFPQSGQRRWFPSIEVLDPLAWRGRDVSVRFSLAKQTRLLMSVNLSGEFDYQITLDGP